MHQQQHNKLAILTGLLLFSTLLGGLYSSVGFQNEIRYPQALSGPPTPSCPVTSSLSSNQSILYIQNCYYQIGINENDGRVSYAAIVQGSNTNIAGAEGLVSEEFDIPLGNNLGGQSHFTSATTTINVNNEPYYLEVGTAGRIINSSNSNQVLLVGTRNLTFFANEPYFIASFNSTIEKAGVYNSHDIANYVNTVWENAWAGPVASGSTVICTGSPPQCSYQNGGLAYTEAESTIDTLPDIKSLIQTNGPTWGWEGNSASTSSAEGIGTLLLSLNSTNPVETFTTHYELDGSGRFEIEGSGVAPADTTSNNEAPHALINASSVPQTMYAAMLVYINNTPYTTFENFINGFWKHTSFGSYLGSQQKFAAFAETGYLPNNNAQPWFITNLATSVSAPIVTSSSGGNPIIYFMGRNDSLANDFPLEMDLLGGSFHFGNGTATVLSNDGIHASLQVTWSDPTDGLTLGMTFNTASNSNKMNVSGYLQSTTSRSSLALQALVFKNYLDGTGAPNQSPTSMNALSWNYSSVGISILFPPSNSGISSANFPNNMEADLNLNSIPAGGKATFNFAVTFYDPLSSFNTLYTSPMYVPTMKTFTQPFGNASQVGFTEDNSRIFSYLLNVTQFNSNQTIAAMQFIAPFSGDLEMYYGGGSAYSLEITFSNGTTVPAAPFYNFETKTFNFNVVSITSASLFEPPTSNTSTKVTCAPNPVASGSKTNCTAVVTGNNPTGPVSWQSSGNGSFSSSMCKLSSGQCGITYSAIGDLSGSKVTITATYLGDIHNSNSSDTFSLSISEINTTFLVAFTCSPSSVQVGSSTTCTFTVTGTLPSSTVNFSSTDTSGTFSPSASCTLSSSGSCQISFTPSASGTTNITAIYPGGPYGTTLHVVESSSFHIGLSVAGILIIGAIVAAVIIIGASIFFRRRPLE